MNRAQHDTFSEGEADSWYSRNKEDLVDTYAGDHLLDYLASLDLTDKRILDVGCGNGHRIARLRAAECVGIEPSALAVKEGNEQYSRIKLIQGVSHDLSMFPDESFDIVTVSFVFHWVDRSKLLKTVSECERVLKDGGLIAIQDFFPASSHRRMYHRNPKLGLFTYKQVYSDIFRASNIYTRVLRMNFLHPNAEHSA